MHNGEAAIVSVNDLRIVYEAQNDMRDKLRGVSIYSANVKMKRA
jgi:hypothetical protein